MKVIFLDIDGVLFLNKDKSYEGWGKEGSIFDANCCRCLKRIIDETGCKLVLTSSLRLHEEGRAEIFKSLAPFNIVQSDFVGTTPDINSVDRSLEIHTYLRKNPAIISYVVIDDNDIGYKIPYCRIIKVDSNRGIDKDTVKKALKILN